MGRYEELVDELREQGMDDLASQFESFSGSSLRQKAEKVPELERLVAEKDAELDRLTRGPKVTSAFEDYGVEMNNLSKLEMDSISEKFSFEGDEPTEDEVAAFVTRYDLPVGDKDPVVDEPSGGRKVAEHARTQNTRGGSKTTLSPKDVEDWDKGKRLDFRDKHPEEWEALKRGESVNVPA